MSGVVASSFDPALANDEASRLVRQAEQRRIVRMLHDSVAQSLTAAYLQAMILVQKMDQDAPGCTAEVSHLADMVHEAVKELREITQSLSSEAENLPVLGFPPEGATDPGQAS